MPKAELLLACLKKLFTKEKRGLLIVHEGLPEPPMLLWFQNLQWALRAHRALCSGSCRTFCQKHGTLDFCGIDGVATAD